MWVGVILAAAVVAGGEPAVCQTATEVRSGPGTAFYATGTLPAGTEVRVHGYENGFAAITPPPGSFSLVAAAKVQDFGDGHLGVKEDCAHARGRAVGVPINRRGRRLVRGHILDVIRPELVMVGGAPVPHYLVWPPEGEYRYVEAAALGSAGRVVQVAAAGLPLPPPAGSELPPPLPETAAEQLRVADAAYRKAEQTGDWTEPQRLYQELAASPHAAVRLTALNRLEFIRLRRSRPAGPATVAAADAAGPAGVEPVVRPPRRVRLAHRPPGPGPRLRFAGLLAAPRPSPPRPRAADQRPAARVAGGPAAHAAGDGRRRRPASDGPAAAANPVRARRPAARPAAAGRGATARRPAACSGTDAESRRAAAGVPDGARAACRRCARPARLLPDAAGRSEPRPTAPGGQERRGPRRAAGHAPRLAAEVHDGHSGA